eukprot:293555-Rhodomonas_salina.2
MGRVVLAWHMVLWAVQYWPGVWCYGPCGTHLAYGGTSGVDDEGNCMIRPFKISRYYSAL